MNGNNGESSPLMLPDTNDDDDDNNNNNNNSNPTHGDTTITTSLRDVSEALIQEYRNVKNALVDAMEDTEDANVVFMSMSLTKASSILPSKPEVVQTVEELEDSLLMRGGSSPLRWVPPGSVQNTPQRVGNCKTTRRTPGAAADTRKPLARAPWQAYLTLGTAVCALSSIGPFLARQKNVSPSLKVRTLICACCCA